MATAFNEEVSYMTLFPDTTFNNVTAPYSMCGPDAFFLQLIYILTNADKIKPGNVQLAFLKRRPDIAQLQLNAANTNNTLPYLRGIINTLLDHLVTPAAFDSWRTIPQQHAAWQQAAAGASSFVPYNRPVASIHAGLASLGLPFSELAYRFSAEGHNSVAFAYTELGLTATDVFILCKPESSIDKFGGATVTPDQVMRFTGLDKEHLLELVYNGLPVNDTAALSQLFINYNTTKAAPLQFIPQQSKAAKGKFENMSMERLLRIRMFLLLADKTGWDYKTLNEVLLKTGTMAFDSANISKQLQPLLQYHFIAKVLGKQFQYILSDTAASTTYSDNISQLVHLAKGLGVSIVDLKTFLDITGVIKLDLSAIYDLCILQQQLTDAGSSLATYIPVVIAIHNSSNSFDAFDQWFVKLQAALKTVTDTYSAAGSDTVTDLPELMFRHWVHELAVYWGVDEALTYNLFAGYISKSGKPDYTAMNITFTSGKNIPGDEANAKSFLEAWYPYVLMADRLKPSAGVLYVFSGKLAIEPPQKEVPPAFKQDYLLQLLELQEVYTHTITAKRTDLLALMGQANLTASIMITALPAITSWPLADIQTLTQKWNVDGNTGGLACVSLLFRLACCFELSTKATLTAAAICGFLDAVASNDFTPIAITAANFEAYLSGIAEKNPGLQIACRQQQGGLLEKDRNVLVPVVLTALNAEFTDIDSWEHLSDYFLNDVSAAGQLDIAPVREGTDALQSYLLRCRSGLENVDAQCLQTITADEWVWIADYRVWQAEQKLLQYPQNYFQVDNRADETSVFRDFKNRLQQSDVDDVVAKEAIQFYIDEWLKLTDKTIVDAYYSYRASDGKSIITFLAKSNAEKHQYYYLEVEATQNGLVNPTPWMVVEASIPAANASIIFIYNKYFIFWSELSTKTDIDPGSEKQKKYHLHTATIKYITQDTRGNWATASIWESFPFYLDLEDPNSKCEIWKKPGDNTTTYMKTLLTPEQPCWLKPIPLIINDTLYVYLSPLIPMRMNVSSAIETSGIIISKEYINFCETVSYAWQKKCPIVLPPRTMNVEGVISARLAPQICSVVEAEFIFPWLDDEGIIKGVAAFPRFSVFDVLKTSVGYYYFASEFGKEGRDLLNVLPQSGIFNGGEDWSFNWVMSIRGMQGALVSTSIGCFILAGDLSIPPLAILEDNNNAVRIENAYDFARFTFVTISNLFPQLYDQYFRVKGLETAMAATVQSAPLSAAAGYDYGNYKYGNMQLPPIQNVTQVQFAGVDGCYARELFFYVPALIAQHLRNNLLNEAAGKWYRYIFNPFTGGAPAKNAWKFYPFFGDTGNVYTNEKKWVVEQYIQNILEWGDNAFRQETWESLSVATQLYFEVSDLLGQEPEVLDVLYAFKTQLRSANTIAEVNLLNYFSWPTDEGLQGLWSRVEDRLYKLRNGLNIDGQAAQPSEYGSPLDPGKVKLALQHGGINPYDDSKLKANNTVYRFRELMPATGSVIDMVSQFGSQLLDVLRQRDSEQLLVLQSTHQLNMERFIVQNYQAQIDEAEAQLLGLQASLAQAQQEQQHYRNLILQGLIAQEASSLQESQSAMQLQGNAASLREGATVAHLIPTIFGFSDGCFQPGSAIDSAAQILAETAGVNERNSAITATKAGYARRAEEWAFNEANITYTISELTAGITAANKRILIAQAGLQQQELAMSQSAAQLDYLNKKFTGGELYNWMSGQLSNLYFKAYQLALAALHRLQTAYAYETNDQSNFIPANSWDSLRKGLLAGDALKLAAARLSSAYMNNNKRRQEAEKIISLKQQYAALFTQFQQTGNISFKIIKDNTWANNEDTLKIHSVSVSIPAVISPYEVFNGSLKNTGSSEQITISRGIDDMGIFPDEINDGRYLPFEGLTIPALETDPEAAWSLVIPGTGVAKRISDVVITIRYKAF